MITILLALLAAASVAFGTVNFGGTRMSTTALTAGGLAQAHFRDLEDGHVDRFNVNISLGLKDNAGGGFNAVVSSGAAEGSDDLDVLLAAIFTNLSLYWETSNVAFNGLTPSQLRTLLILFNRRDFEGTFINGAAIPANNGAATTFRIAIPVPVSLRNYFEDGDITGRGATCMSEGQGRFDFNMASSLTPTAVLHSGTAVVSALSVYIGVNYSDGDTSDCGPSWRARRPTNLKYIGEKWPSATRIGVLDMTANAATDVTAYSFLSYRNVPPSEFTSRWQADRLRDGGGYDLSARCVPLIFPSPGTKFLDFANIASAEWSWDVISTNTAATVMDVWMMDPDPVTVGQVNGKVGHGGTTAETIIRPPSFGSADSVPPALAGMVKHRFRPGKVAGATTHSTPHSAIAGIQKTNQAAKRAVSARNAARARRR